MKYISTRGGQEEYSAAEAIIKGIANNGGLLVPAEIPKLSITDIEALVEMTYQERAYNILSLYLDDFQTDDLKEAIAEAYAEEKFGEKTIPLSQLNEYNPFEYLLELFHGPTVAFKDVALQLLPHLMTLSLRYANEKKDICILTATSGDTGKAALEGFKNVPGTSVIVYYPEGGVSPAQERQMRTQEGNNCHVVAIKGSFDDAQNGVKEIFADETLKQALLEQGVQLSSANSINWGRLVSQIVYYFSAYADLLSQEKIEKGEKINFVVPTGNFGNILAAWYAGKMGLPIKRLVCASNKNKVLADFIQKGIYDKKREFYQTNSPSMDILISSNLERLLFEITGRNAEKINQWMEELQTKGFYKIDKNSLNYLQGIFVGGFATEEETLKTISETYDRTDHLVDTHTAVGVHVYQKYLKRNKDESKVVYVSTASPFKFSFAVGEALFGKKANAMSEADLCQLLAEESDMEIPLTISDSETKPFIHNTVIEKAEMKNTVLEYLSKK